MEGVHRLNVKDMPTTSTCTKAELMAHFTSMTNMRRMEIQSDMLYKKREIRGFCHLGDGQEAIAEGMETGMTK